MCGSVAKDFQQLMKSIASFSNNQAEVCHYEDNLDLFEVEIVPNDGFYCGGKFNFRLTLKDYPKTAPSVTCVTQIYHPNIDNESGDICLNLFDEWTKTSTLEDCVQGLLFLLYNPNLDDPLSPLFDPECDNDFDNFAENVRRSLEGGEVEGCTFERNLVNGDESTITTNKATDCQRDDVQQICQNAENETEDSDSAVTGTNGCEIMDVNYTNDAKADLQVLSSVTNTETNGDSNLNTKSNETTDWISGKVHPHRTEEDIAVTRGIEL